MRAAYLAAAAVTAAALAATAGTAHAQSARPIQFGLGAGASIPTGAFSDRVNTGTAITGNAAYRFRGTPVSVRADIAYNSYGLADSYLERFRRADDGGANIWAGTLNLMLDLPRAGRVRPYLIGGGGVYRRHVEVDRAVGQQIISVFDPFFGFYDEIFTDEAPIRSHTQTKFGLNGGAGIMIPMAGVHTFVEARYHDALTDARQTGFVPIMIGVEW